MNPRIRLETEAVLAILGAPPERIEFVRADAQDLENDFNPVASRAARVRAWLDERPAQSLLFDPLAARTEELMGLGLKGFDALHVASAELAGAGTFLTCDDRLLRTAQRNAARLRVRVLDPITFSRELFP